MRMIRKQQYLKTFLGNIDTLSKTITSIKKTGNTARILVNEPIHKPFYWICNHCIYLAVDDATVPGCMRKWKCCQSS